MTIGFLAAFLSLTDSGIKLEEEWGLAWLFTLRGEVEPPKQITVVSIDKASADILRLPEDPEKWPRTYHAELIRKINLQEPALIAFNLYFGETRFPENDELLAEAMGEKRNVVLSSYLRQFVSPHGGFLKHLRYEHIIEPVPMFTREALAIAPFPLPKTASTVKEIWTYRRNAGDIATFPAAIFLSYLVEKAYPEVREIIRRADPEFAATLPAEFNRLEPGSNLLYLFQRIRWRWLKYPEKFAATDEIIESLSVSDEKSHLLRSWTALLKGDDYFFINHYGKAGSVTTVPFYQVLVSEIINPNMFRDKIVLIGYSEDIEPERTQGFYTVFSENNVETVSPIELAATAVGNLLDRSGIRPLELWFQFFLILGWSFSLFLACRLLAYKFAVSAILTMAVVYSAAAYYLFVQFYLWIPVLFPVFVLAPLFLILASVKHYQRKKKEHRKIYRTFSHYLPDDVVDSLVREPEGGEIGGYGQMVEGVCMATDAGQYTAMSETMDPQCLRDTMNRYYGVIFPRVSDAKGLITDVIGDAMMAVWVAGDADAEARLNACRAALNIRDAVARFNADHDSRLPTRMGLHYGRMHLGNVGAGEHYEYRAVGDVVNTASRLEGLNKLLGTRLLVSDGVIENLPGLLSREIGSFLLKGKTQPVRVYELIAVDAAAEPGREKLFGEFEHALNLVKQNQWPEALQAFRLIADRYPEDGPTQFYKRYLQNNLPLSCNNDVKDISIIEVGNITTALL